MGYGYLGSYLVYGIELTDAECKAIQDDNERMNFLRNQEESSEGNIHIKEYGMDRIDFVKCFIYWKCAFRGGGMWDPSYISDSYNMKNGVTIEEMLDIEQSYNAEEMEAYCKKHSLPFRSPKWQTLLCCGSCIY